MNNDVVNVASPMCVSHLAQSNDSNTEEASAEGSPTRHLVANDNINHGMQ